MINQSLFQHVAQKAGMAIDRVRSVMVLRTLESNLPLDGAGECDNFLDVFIFLFKI